MNNLQEYCKLLNNNVLYKKYAPDFNVKQLSTDGYVLTCQGTGIKRGKHRASKDHI